MVEGVCVQGVMVGSTTAVVRFGLGRTRRPSSSKLLPGGASWFTLDHDRP
jgi:hypothetical protein